MSIVPKVLTIFYNFSAEILCDFEENLCQWANRPVGAKFKFLRRNALQIGDEPGPNNDYQGKNDTFFMIASKEISDGNPNDIARFRSPVYKKDEHPMECFSFRFNFGVRYFH